MFSEMIWNAISRSVVGRGRSPGPSNFFIFGVLATVTGYIFALVTGVMAPSIPKMVTAAWTTVLDRPQLLKTMGLNHTQGNASTQFNRLLKALKDSPSRWDTNTKQVAGISQPSLVAGITLAHAIDQVARENPDMEWSISMPEDDPSCVHEFERNFSLHLACLADSLRGGLVWNSLGAF